MNKTHTPMLVCEKTQSTEERPERSTSTKTEKAWNDSHAVTAVTTSTHEYERIYIRTEESECNPDSFSCVTDAYQLHSTHYTFQMKVSHVW
jgi:hypothetical protein